MKLVKKLLSMVMVGAMCLSFVACAPDEADEDPNVVKTEGSITVECTGVKTIKDSDGKDAVMVKVKAKNGTNKEQVLKQAITVAASQNGNELETAIVIEEIDPAQANVDKKMDKETELEGAFFFKLKDTTSPVKVRMTPKSGTDKETKEVEMPLAQ